jgi:uncharacterized delta-60 repeat protein
MKKINIVIAIILVLGSFSGQGQILDPSFNGTGIWTLDPQSTIPVSDAIAVDGDGKILIGTTRWLINKSVFYVKRLLPDGSSDPSFGTNGLCEYTLGPGQFLNLTSISVVGNGAIIAGRYQGGYALCKILNNGELDPGFGSNGFFLETNSGFNHSPIGVTNIQILPDSSFYIESLDLNCKLCVLKSFKNGGVDPGFGINGYYIQNDSIDDPFLFRLKLQSDGKLILLNNYRYDTINDYSLFRLNTNGSLDSSFGQNGSIHVQLMIARSWAYNICIQADDKILTTGTQGGCAWYIYAIRHNPDGSIDPSFGNNGLFLSSEAGHGIDVDQLSNDNILLTAETFADDTLCRYTYIRLNNLGQVDSSFNGSGIFRILPGSPADVAVESILYENCGILTCGFAKQGASTILMKLVKLNACFQGVVSVNEYPEASDKLFIAPNPVSRIVSFSQIVEYAEVYSILGHSVIREREVKSLDISGQPCGIYLIKAINKGKTYSFKVVKNGQ